MKTFLLIVLAFLVAFSFAATPIIPEDEVEGFVDHHITNEHHSWYWRQCHSDFMKYCQSEVHPPYNEDTILGSKCLNSHMKRLTSGCRHAVERYHDLEHRIERECQPSFAKYCPSMSNKEFNEHSVNQSCIRHHYHEFDSDCKSLLQQWEREHAKMSVRRFLSQHIYVFVPVLIITFVVLFTCMFLFCVACCAACRDYKKSRRNPVSRGYAKVDLEMPEQEQMLNDTEMSFIVPVQQQHSQFFTSAMPPMYQPGNQNANPNSIAQPFYVMYPQQGMYPVYIPQPQQVQQQTPNEK